LPEAGELFFEGLSGGSFPFRFPESCIQLAGPGACFGHPEQGLTGRCLHQAQAVALAAKDQARQLSTLGRGGSPGPWAGQAGEPW